MLVIVSVERIMHISEFLNGNNGYITRLWDNLVY